jgi:hypothetical protein
VLNDDCRADGGVRGVRDNRRLVCLRAIATEQYDFSLVYVGHAEKWDKVEINGRLDAEEHDCKITYSSGGKKLAVALVSRDLEGLRAELEFERVIRGKAEDGYEVNAPVRFDLQKPEGALSPSDSNAGLR